MSGELWASAKDALQRVREEEGCRQESEPENGEAISHIADDHVVHERVDKEDKKNKGSNTNAAESHQGKFRRFCVWRNHGRLQSRDGKGPF